MRINVYAEEITLETTFVSKVVTDAEFGTRTFYGVRMFLDSPVSLHATGEDDDRSAITFWVPWTQDGGNNFYLIEQLFASLESSRRGAVRHSQAQ